MSHSHSLSVGLAATLVDSTHLKLTFTGSSIIGGSLADGRYNLVCGVSRRVKRQPKPRSALESS